MASKKLMSGRPWSASWPGGCTTASSVKPASFTISEPNVTRKLGKSSSRPNLLFRAAAYNLLSTFVASTVMDQEATTAAVQKYLEGLAGDTPTDPIIRELLDRATRRLYHLCAALLHRNYPRLERPSLNLDANEMLGAVVERLLKALREIRPGNV